MDKVPNKSGALDDSTIPLYFQLMNYLKQQIETGLLKPGDLIPSESQLCSGFGLSRTTVRQALNRLVEEGMLVRRRGMGSFVADRKLHRNLNHLYSFSEDMFSMGIKPYSKILVHKTVDAGDDISELLKLPQGKPEVFQLTRLRIANDEPLLLETTYIPLYLCPDIAAEDFAHNSLYSVLRSRYSLNLFKAVETYEAVKLDRKTAELLGCKQSTSAFEIQRTGYLNTGTAFELTRSLARGDKCMFRVELYADKNRVSFHRELNV